MQWFRILPRATVAAVAAIAVTGALLEPGAASAEFSGFAPELTRAPYLSDVSQTGVRVNWMTTTQTRGVVKYGPIGNCAASMITMPANGVTTVVNGITQYRSSIRLPGLAAGASYCYRVFTGGTPVDLLGSNPSPQFTTLESATSTKPYTFAVFGDWGDTTNRGVNNGSINVNQAALMSQIANSGARFAVSTGDVAYPNGSQTQYGDLNQTGINISGVFGPSYWATPGMTTPLHGVTGNHGLNATFLNTWPQSSSASASAGVYASVSYPSINGSNPAAYPTNYYAFTTGGVRFYMLTAAWADSNVGTATGGACGTKCKSYEVDHNAHWTLDSAERKWLENDLATHPGGLKMAAFHFPLRSDDQTEPDDNYLKWTSGSTGKLEELLHNQGVQLVFNGHAHIYQRNVAPPEGVISYVAGGGGGKTSVVSKCSTTDAYARGWSYTANKGSKCGAAPIPTSDAQIYHFLKVTVSGKTVTVTPTDSQGNIFDPITYDFANTEMPPAPTSLTATRPTAGTVALDWSAGGGALRIHGRVSAYDIYRDGRYIGTTSPSATRYTDSSASAQRSYEYRVSARSLRGRTRSKSVMSHARKKRHHHHHHNCRMNTGVEPAVEASHC
jgi:hypothetical protein